MKRYNAFISYSHTDCKDIAGPIQDSLQNLGKPWYKELSTNLKIYRDQTNLSASPGFWPDIEKALQNSNNLILLASPQAANSKWITKELNVWIEKSYSTEKGLQNIYIILCEGDIEWDENKKDFDWTKTNCLPKTISKFFKNEPLWVDLKNYIKNSGVQKVINYEDFGFSEQIAKVIGGIIDKPPVEIISKELQRVKKLRNIYVSAGISLFCLLLIVGYLFFLQRKTNYQLKDKNEELNIAKTDIEKQRDNAINNLKKFKIEEFQRNIRNGRVFIDAEEYCLAKNVFRAAKVTADDTLCSNSTEVLAEKHYLISSLKICENYKKCQ